MTKKVKRIALSLEEKLDRIFKVRKSIGPQDFFFVVQLVNFLSLVYIENQQLVRPVMNYKSDALEIKHKNYSTLYFMMECLGDIDIFDRYTKLQAEQ